MSKFDQKFIYAQGNWSNWKSTRKVLSLVSLSPGWLTHRIMSDRVHCQFITISYFRADRFVQLLSLIPILILLLYLLVTIDIMYTGTCELDIGTVLKENDCLLNYMHLFCC